MKIELRVTVTADDGRAIVSALHVEGVTADYKAVTQALDSMTHRLRSTVKIELRVTVTVVASHVPGWDGYVRARPGN